MTILHWFRQDLRLSDNPALTEAARLGKILPVYILDDTNAKTHAVGSASRWWLHYSLHALNQSLDGHLAVYRGDPKVILASLCERYQISTLCWNRCYEPWRIARDTHIKSHFEKKQITVKSFNGSLLWEPWEITKHDGTHYRVFTPFYRKGCLQAPPPREPLKAPSSLSFASHDEGAMAIDDLGLLPNIRWDQQLEPHWHISEAAAHQRLNDFLDDGIEHYKEGRNFPAQPHVSRLSPYLHFGEISPNQVWYTARGLKEDHNIDCFCSELGWREFSYSLLYHHPELPTKNLQEKFDRFPWDSNPAHLRAWQQGQTGIPIVDAGMRELWQTGYMHNRVRMIVGSFLVKNLLTHWHEGEKWFWDCLVDADLANNSASWQWIAGCGADAAPYFRIFNPVTQGQKFDADGEYTKKYVPELAALPNKYVFNPWEAPEKILKDAGVTLGRTYPKPIVDLKTSRERALAAFKQL